MITLKKWNHPTTGETRVYLNGSFSSRGIKAFIVKDTNSVNADALKVKVFADYSTNLEEIENDIYAEICDERKLDSFSKVLNAAQ